MSKDKIALVLIVKNEAHVIYEWLAHHAGIGVDHFLIYENGSTDGTVAEIRAFPEQRRITLIDWPMTFGQMPAYADAIKRFGRRFRWMGFIDADEFLIPLKDESLADILASFRDHAGLAVPWSLFGSNGHDRRPPGLVLENYTRRAPHSFVINRHVKCLMQPARIAYLTASPHIFIPKEGWRIVREDGAPVDHSNSSLDEDFQGDRLRLHHYVVQSREDFEIKRARGLVNPSQPRDEAFRDLHDRNEEEDLSALRYASRVKAWLQRRLPPRARLGQRLRRLATLSRPPQ